jgi:hypothetical protein
MVLGGHWTRNDCAAAGNAAAQNTNNKMQVISNFLLVMRPPSPPKAAIILPGCGTFCWINLLPQQCPKSSTSTAAQIFDRN